MSFPGKRETLSSPSSMRFSRQTDMESYLRNRKIDKICKYLSFGTIALLIVYMAVLTVLEKVSGTAAVMDFGYRSAVFIALWAVAAVSGLIHYFISAGHRAYAVSGIHIAFAFILAGALVTHLTGRQGVLHLRTGEESRVFIDGDMEECRFPFSVSLKDFEVVYYPGTFSPTDYVSTLSVTDGGYTVELSVSMNRIGKYKGYRFYQSSYDEDGNGSTLSISYDPVGLPVTYTGYALLILSLVGFFFRKDSGFRNALHRLSKAGAAVMLAVLSAASMSVPASAASSDGAGSGAASSAGNAVARLPKHLPEKTAREFGRMFIYCNDRICPMQTFARDFTMKLYGRRSYMGLDPEQVLTGWIFYADSWEGTLESASGDGTGSGKKAEERQELVMMVRTASILKTFPYAGEDGSVMWYSPVDRLPAEMDSGQWIFIRKVMSLAGEDIVKQDFEAAAAVFGKIREYQEKTAGDFIPSASREAAERLYNTVERPRPLAIFCVTAGLVLFILYGLFPGVARGRSPWRIAAAVLSGLVFLYLTFVLMLRWYVSAHVPMSNGFEVMLLLAWHTMMLGTFIQRKFPLIMPFAFLLGGFALLVASIGESDPAIAYLMPVLSSPLLSLHVMAMMISYTLLGLAMLNSIMGLLRYGRSRDGSFLSFSADVSLVFLYPAVAFLAAGTFLGAVWANISWGSYWAWDPKEVWALITLLVYSFALHGRSLAVFRKPVFFHWFCILAFLCVIITYFGVNFFLGGLHSYA